MCFPRPRHRDLGAGRLRWASPNRSASWSASTRAIKIAVLDDITGVTSIEGALMRVSMELVVQQTNSTGGIRGHPIQVLYADPRDDPSQAIQLATQLVE